MDKKTTLSIIAFILVLIVIVVILNNITFPPIRKQSAEEKHEAQLIAEGKTKTSDDVIKEIAEIFKNRDEKKVENYLSSNFTYYNNNNIQYKSLSNFWFELSSLSSIYEIEKRGNSVQDKETYRIYWNVSEQNKANGVQKAERFYCFQTITIYLHRIVQEDMITYEIEKIILKNV